MGTKLFGCYFGADTFAVVVDPVLNPASPQAEALRHLFAVTLFVCGVIFLIVTTLVIICIVRFRRKADAPEPPQITGSQKLEITWTTLSILILVGLFVLTVHAMHASDPVTHRAPDLTVIGHQWWWEIRYPDGVMAANEIHIPIGKNLLMRVESADVIHDFWVPALGRKMDMVPGNKNQIWIRADKPGQYLGACAEYCGAEHAWMRILVVAQTPKDYQKWLAHQSEPAELSDPAANAEGLRIFEEKTCINCHTIKGVDPETSVAPDLTHLAGRQTLGAGVLPNTPGNLRRWLANTQAVKPGCHMPNFRLSDAEVEALARYLETLK